MSDSVCLSAVFPDSRVRLVGVLPTCTSVVLDDETSSDCFDETASEFGLVLLLCLVAFASTMGSNGSPNTDAAVSGTSPMQPSSMDNVFDL